MTKSKRLIGETELDIKKVKALPRRQATIEVHLVNARGDVVKDSIVDIEGPGNPGEAFSLAVDKVVEELQRLGFKTHVSR